MILKLLPYGLMFAVTLLATLILTPLVREFNRRLGMVDKPDPRRINKVPIPRGGGLALFLGVFVPMVVGVVFFDPSFSSTGSLKLFWRLVTLALAIVALGYADDKFSLPPKVKLLGQLVIAFLTWWWADLGFNDIWPSIPAWLDCLLTVFWIVGAVNAFNLIDGLDGLATGIALIATLGMTGALFFVNRSGNIMFNVAFIGGLLGFLRYNYNPASVFLGDSGSMLIGFVLSVMPLYSHAENSFLVSIGVPLLAMGVPIFDTSLAILRRSIRRLLNLSGSNVDGSRQVMTADSDHLHHRILRAAGLNQRKAAWTMYAFAAFLVIVGLVGISLKSRTGGLWLAAVAIASVVVFRDMARIELFDAGVLLDRLAHSRNTASRRRLARLTIPCLVVADVVVLVGAYLFICWVLKIPLRTQLFRTAIPIYTASTFAVLVFFRAYVTIWPRAVISNFLRLFLACAFGAVLGSIAAYYLPSVPAVQMKAFTLLYALLTFIGCAFLRILRPVVRDTFYVIAARRLVGRKDVSRMLVYGTGLRYRAFRRELVRSASASSRIIVGLIDDDILLRHHYIGGCQVLGTLSEAPAIINELNVDTIVIACVMDDAWRKVVADTLVPTGVKITWFNYEERVQ